MFVYTGMTQRERKITIMTNYTEAVTEARTLVKRSETDQWRLAQLTWENASPYEADGKMSLTQWSRDVGVSLSYAGRLRRVWENYQTTRNLDEVQNLPPFNEAYREVSPHSAYTPPADAVRDMQPERKAEVARELLADPAVADQVVSDPAFGKNVWDARVRKERTRQAEVQRTLSDNPDLGQANRKLGDTDAQLSLGQVLSKFAAGVAEVLPRCGPVNEGERFWIEGARDRAQLALNAVNEYLATGELISDDELTRMAAGESA